MSNENWRGVTRREPCPICGKATWCGRSLDGRYAICMRTESCHPTRNGGWLFVFDDERREWVEPSNGNAPHSRFNGPSCALRPLGRKTIAPRIESASVAAEMAKDADYGLAYDLADFLLPGIPVAALIEAVNSLGVYLSRKHWKDGTLAIPMRNADGVPVGIRYRATASGQKWSERGGRNGVFFSPRVIASKHHRALFVVEGFTDTLAMAAIGLPVIGRASCLTGADEIATIVRRASPACVYIIADNDDTHFAAGRAYMPGRRGADELAKRLTRPAAILFLGNHKDARDFITARLTAGMSAETIAAEIQRLATEATPRARALRPRITPARVFLGNSSSSSSSATVANVATPQRIERNI